MENEIAEAHLVDTASTKYIVLFMSSQDEKNAYQPPQIGVWYWKPFLNFDNIDCNPIYTHLKRLYDSFRFVGCFKFIEMIGDWQIEILAPNPT